MKNGMKQFVLLTSATAMALTMVGCGTNMPGNFAAERTANFAAQAKPGEIIVKFRSNAGRQALLQKLGLRTVKKVNRLDAIVVQGKNVKAALAELNNDRAVEYAEPNFVAKAFQVQQPMPAIFDNDLLPKLWGLNKIEAPAAWALTKGGEKVTVAVVDTGIDYRHSEFGNRVAKGRDFINNDDDAMDDHYHGTHCAGSVGGARTGVAPNVNMIAVKVLSRSGSGSYDGVANGIIYAADQGAEVISMSLGGPAGSKVIEDAVNYAISKGSLVVAAMGNDNSERPSYPASAPGVMAVGSTTVNDTRSSFSNYGKHISVSAPGSDIYSTVPGGGYKNLSGTSMATPHVAGLVALVKSQFPSLNAAGLQKKVEAAADDHGDAGFDKYFGHGRINALKAVK